MHQNTVHSSELFFWVRVNRKDIMLEDKFNPDVFLFEVVGDLIFLMYCMMTYSAILS